MNEKINEIQKLLLAKNIVKYNIVHECAKGLFFNLSNGNIIQETKNTNQILVSFEKGGKFSKFSISDSYDAEKVEQIIELCLKNSCVSKISKSEEHYTNSTDLKIIYDEFNIQSYIKWLKNELNILLENINFKFNFVYTVDVLKNVVISNNNCYKSYKSSSTCGCMESVSFKQSAFLNDYFLNSNISKALILKLKSN